MRTSGIKIRLRVFSRIVLGLAGIHSLAPAQKTLAVAPSAQPPTVSYSIYLLSTQITVVTAGPDGAVWFLEPNVNRIGRITAAGAISEYATPHRPGGLTAGPDGALWFTEETVPTIGRMTTGGSVTEYALPCTVDSNGQSNCGAPEAITAGPDGALWFTECCSNSKIGRITTTGNITQYIVNAVEAYSITSGPDGAVWFLGWLNGGVRLVVGRITPSGQSTTYIVEPVPDVCFPGPLINGPDGNLWFGDPCYGMLLAQFTTAGVLGQQFLIPSRNGPAGLTVGPDTAIWFPEINLYSGTPTHALGRLFPDGTITEYNVPVNNITAGASITTAPDGAIWFTDGANTIIRTAIAFGLTITTTSLPAGFISTPYSKSVTAVGGTAPYAWSVSAGSLPSGLSLDPLTGAISGTPTSSGSSFTVRVTDSSSPPQSATASFSIAVSNPTSSFSMVTSPPGLSITVDSSSYATPFTFPCTLGTQHTLAVSSPQGAGIFGIRYVFTGWSDGAAATRVIACPSAPVTYQANFSPQYLLTTAVSPPGAGSITANPAASDGFYNSGAVVQLTASANFLNWSSDLTGSANPQSIFMSAPRSVVANFAGAMRNGCIGMFSGPADLVCSAMTQGAFQGSQAVSIGAQATYFGAMTLVGNVPFGDASGMALYNAGGGGGASVSLDLYNTPSNGGIPQAKIKAIDDGNYSDHLSFWTKIPGGPGNSMAERVRITSTGNVGIGTTIPTRPLEMGSGANVSAGGVWNNASDRNAKENFVAVTPAAILLKINALPLMEWNYRNEDPSVRHIGPVAQDFYSIFGVGSSASSITTIDTAGIALAGIQGLDEKSQERALKLAELKRQLQAKGEELRSLQQGLARLESLLEQTPSANTR